MCVRNLIVSEIYKVNFCEWKYPVYDILVKPHCYTRLFLALWTEFGLEECVSLCIERNLLDKEDSLKPAAHHIDLFHLLACPGPQALVLRDVRCGNLQAEIALERTQIACSLLYNKMLVNFSPEYWSSNRRVCRTGFDAPAGMFSFVSSSSIL